MKKKITWIVLAVLLVALIGGASVLYDRLGSAYEVDQLATQAPVAPQTEAPAETEIPNETETPEETEAQAETEPMTAPDFTALDAQGNEVRLSDYFGKPIVLNFWASWCGPCKSEMPDFEEAYQTYGSDVEFMMVNLTDGSRETVETAKAFIAEQNFTFPVYFDTANEAAIAYQASSIPATYFIDKNGNIIAHAVGMLDKANILKGIEMILE